MDGAKTGLWQRTEVSERWIYADALWKEEKGKRVALHVGYALQVIRFTRTLPNRAAKQLHSSAYQGQYTSLVGQDQGACTDQIPHGFSGDRQIGWEFGTGVMTTVQIIERYRDTSRKASGCPVHGNP